jgi:hypothetical protein
MIHISSISIDRFYFGVAFVAIASVLECLLLRRCQGKSHRHGSDQARPIDEGTA